MIQRLLRGRWFYVVLTGFVLGLVYYGRAAGVGSWGSYDLIEVEVQPRTEGWWSEDVDPDMFRAAAAADPLLRVTLAGLSLFTIGMTVGGVLLTIWALLTGRIRALWRGPFRRPLPWTLGECVRIVLLILLMVPLLHFVRLAVVLLAPGWTLDPNLWVNASMLLLDGLLLMTICVFAAGKTGLSGNALGLSRRGVSQAITTGVRGYVAIFPWLLLLLVLVVQLARAFDLEPPVQPIHELLFGEERPAVLGLTILLACLVGPVAEEVFFRGVFFAALRQRISRWAAVLLSGALFASVHTNLIGFLPILLLGCLLADLYERTGSLVSPIAIHILHNTFLLTVALTYRWVT